MKKAPRKIKNLPSFHVNIRTKKSNWEKKAAEGG
jgi:hypothetical protein